MADFVDTAAEEVEETVQAPVVPVLSRQLSSTFSNQETGRTCAVHSCIKVVIKFLKTLFKTSFEFLNTDDTFDERGNPCNAFYEEKFLRGAFKESFTEINSRDHKCIHYKKEFTIAILNTFIYKLLIDNFECNGGDTKKELEYILYYLYIFPVTFDYLSYIIGINIDEIPDAESKALISEAITNIVHLLEMFREKYENRSPVYNIFLNDMELADLKKKRFKLDKYVRILKSIFHVLKEHIIKNGQYISLAIVNDRVSHALTIVDITEDTIIIKDSYGIDTPTSYPELMSRREKGVIEVKIDNLVDILKLLTYFRLVFLSEIDTYSLFSDAALVELDSEHIDFIDPWKKNSYKNVLLRDAIYDKKIPTYQALLIIDIDLTYAYAFLISAIIDNNNELAKLLIDKYTPGTLLYDPRSNALVVALKNNNDEIAEVLIEKGVLVNTQDEITLNTPLHYAIENEDYTLVDLLLKHDASVTIKNRDGQTPLELSEELSNDTDDPVIAGIYDLLKTKNESSGGKKRRQTKQRKMRSSRKRKNRSQKVKHIKRKHR
jgi:hypothetical protein